MKSLFVSLFTTSLLTGCQLSTDSSEALRVVVAISPAMVRGGDTALVTVRLINQSLHATTVSGSSTCRLAFDVLDNNGVRVGGIRPSVCTMDLRNLTLAPGQSDSEVFHWVAAHAPGQPLPPGSYTVVGASLWAQGRTSAPQPFAVVAP